MKGNLFGVVTVAALVVLGAWGLDAHAQENPQASTPAQPPAGAFGSRTNLQNRLKQVAAELNLSPDQRTKLMATLRAEAQEARSLRQDTSLSRQEKMAKRKEILDALDAKIKAVLSPDQYAKWKELRPTVRPNGRRQSGAAPPSGGNGGQQ
jgi:hypothetical protein